jgi:flavin-dependent dehydrogenase
MRSARILANAIAKNKPNLYEKEWKETFEKTFMSYHWAEKFFLYSDFMSNKMLKFFKYLFKK